MSYFDDKNKEYVITDMFPRRELLNYLWNESTVCVCDQFGGGSAWSQIGHTRRQIDAGERNVYIKNRCTGAFYSANRNYARLPFTLHECHVGLGYQRIIGEYEGIRTEFTVSVPATGNLVLFDIRVENKGDAAREIDVYFCNQPKPALSDHDAYGEADFNEESNCIIYSHDGFEIGMPYTRLYLASSEQPDAYEVAYERFRGVYESYANPVALQKEKLSCKGISFESCYVGALQFRLQLRGGQSWRTTLACGTEQSNADCKQAAEQYASADFYEKALKEIARAQEGYAEVFHGSSPDKVLNSQVNIWLKRQLSLGKTWGRVYGKGFRDVMQDITAFISFDCRFARARILEILKHQFEDGNPIRMFEPDFPYPYNDGGVWIPAAVLSYLNESGDLSLLDEKIPYLKGDSYENTSYGAPIAYREYNGTAESFTLFDHVQRAMDYLYGCRGTHGLVLLRGGDWNDSLNNAGRLGRGEGVWLTIATVKAYNEFLEILKLSGRDMLIEKYATRRNELKEKILAFGSDGDHLLYAYNDDGEKIGSNENEFAKIYLNPQTWAVLADIAEETTLRTFMNSVEERLSCDYGYLQCYPSYRKGDDKIGRISFFKPGLVENGSVYNHGVAFKIMADCILGRGDSAYESLKKIRFDNPANPENGMEPYAVSNMFIGPENSAVAGYAPMSWITGTAGWLYRCITEYIFGIRATFRGLEIKPCFPSAWNRLTARRKFRGATYQIEYVRAENGKRKMELDGKEIVGNRVPTDAGGGTHVIKVWF